MGLNAKFDFKWEISDTGYVFSFFYILSQMSLVLVHHIFPIFRHVDLSNAQESNDKYSQFEAMSKVNLRENIDLNFEIGLMDDISLASLNWFRLVLCPLTMMFVGFGCRRA